MYIIVYAQYDVILLKLILNVRTVRVHIKLNNFLANVSRLVMIRLLIKVVISDCCRFRPI